MPFDSARKSEPVASRRASSRVVRHTVISSALIFVAALTLGAQWEDPIRQALPPPAPPMDNSYEGVLFWDSFARGLGAWTPDREGVWSVRGGMLRADLPDRKNQHSFLFAGKETWTDYALEFHVLAMRGVDKGAAVRVEGRQGIALDLRGPGYHDVVLHREAMRFGQANVINANGMWHHVRIEARGKRFSVWVDGEHVLERTDTRRGRLNGRVALAAHTGGGGECTIYFDNVVVRKLDPDPPLHELTAAESDRSDDD